MKTTLDSAKKYLKNSGTIKKLIIINVTIFILLNMVNVFLTLFNVRIEGSLIDAVGVPSDFHTLRHRPWTLLTYMFVHKDFLHLLFNMLWLYWFGAIYRTYFSGKSLTTLYLLGGLSGAIFYILAFNYIPYYIDMNGTMIGASASVMAIVAASALYHPNLTMNLLFIGRIKIIYIALGVLIIDMMSLSSAVNAGGHVAHIGGAVLGAIYVMLRNRGYDITAISEKITILFQNMFSSKKRHRPKMKVTRTHNENDYEYNYRKNNESKEIDTILDKVKQSGYSSLSAEEKKRLFDASKK